MFTLSMHFFSLISSAKVSHINHGSILEAWPKLVSSFRAKDKTTGRGEETTSISDSDNDAQVRASEEIYSIAPSPKVCTLSFYPVFFYTLPTVNNKYRRVM